MYRIIFKKLKKNFRMFPSTIMTTNQTALKSI